MKNIQFKKILKTIQILIVSTLLLSSCEKTIKIDLKSAQNKIVVQGNISSLPGPYSIKLENTVNYYDSNTFPPLSGALVNISTNDGSSENLAESSAGVYKTNTLIGKPGKTYTLKIVAGGKTYTSIDRMPETVALDSFNITKILSGGFRQNDNSGYRVSCKFTDLPGLGNYYRVVISSADTAAIGNRTSRIVSDKFGDGQQLSVTFRTTLKLNDSVSVSLQCISKATL